MKKVLVDTSVWIDAFNDKATWQTKLLGELIDQNSPVVLCPTIIQEILQGIRKDADFEKVRENLSGFEVLEMDAVEAAEGAASLYRDMRKKGVTISKSNDCLIAYYAIANDAVLLHSDHDFIKIAKSSGLNILLKGDMQ